MNETSSSPSSHGWETRYLSEGTLGLVAAVARSGVVLKRRWGRVFVSALQNIKALQQTLPAHSGDHDALLPTEGPNPHQTRLHTRGCQTKYPISGATVVGNKKTTSDIKLPEQLGILTLWRPGHPKGGLFFFNGQSWTIFCDIFWNISVFWTEYGQKLVF